MERSGNTRADGPSIPEMLAALHRTVELLKKPSVHEVIERDFDHRLWRMFYRAHVAWSSAGNFAAGMAAPRRSNSASGANHATARLGPLALARHTESGQARSPAQRPCARWQAAANDELRKILAGFEDIDVYLCPVMGQPVPEIGYVDPVNLEPREVNKRQGRLYPFTPPFNFSGQPSMSLPLEMDARGLPIGMMFTAKYADEATLFRLAAQLEKEAPWSGRKPQVWG